MARRRPSRRKRRRPISEELRHWEREETGYQWIQGTKPQTLAYGLTDSPVGLAAWIVEKFRTWSDCGGDVERRFTKDTLLTNVMLYWVTGRHQLVVLALLRALARVPGRSRTARRIAVPTGLRRVPHARSYSPPRAVGRSAVYANIQRWTAMKAGGHFAALEEPDALAEDVRAFFRR